MGPLRDGQERVETAAEDAKRFARLIVSEIKLYNEAKVTFKAHPNVDAWNSLKAAVADRKAVLEGGAA